MEPRKEPITKESIDDPFTEHPREDLPMRNPRRTLEKPTEDPITETLSRSLPLRTLKKTL